MISDEDPAAAIREFITLLFRYAEEGSYVSLRAFAQFDRGKPPVMVLAVKIAGLIEDLADSAQTVADYCDNLSDPGVFAPPICTFSTHRTARTADIQNGLVLSVEIDDVDPDDARQRLEGIIGPATCVVTSGSEWTSPETGEIKLKAHLHWRLSEPTTTPEEHDRLRRARSLAAALVGADPTGSPVVHPFRWPGSLNRKKPTAPRMAAIAHSNSAAEINLGEALDALEEVMGHDGWNVATGPQGAAGGAVGVAGDVDIGTLVSAMDAIPNPGTAVHYDTWIRLGYAAYRATGGSLEGLDMWERWSRKSGKYDARETDLAWKRIASACSSKPPARIIGAGTIYYMAAQAGWAPPIKYFQQHPQSGATGGSQAGKSPFPPGGADEAPEYVTAGAPLEIDAYALQSADLENLRNRRWIYGRELVRNYVSVLGSPGGTGKTAYAIAVALSIVTGRALLDPHPLAPSPQNFLHKPGARVWINNLEDPMEEMLLRLKGAFIRHKIQHADVDGKLFVNSGRDQPLIITQRIGNALVATPVVDALVAAIKARQIDVLIIDPFVQSHTAEENRNDEMNLVMSLWGVVAAKGDCAVWLIHHFRKGGQAGDSESFRGAVAVQGAARVMSTLSVMSAEEADKLGVPVEEKWQYIRKDSAKANLAPQADRADWFQLASVPIGNPTLEYPLGDNVQTVLPWKPPTAFDGVPWSDILRCLQMIDDGPGGGDFYSEATQAKRWAGHAIMATLGKTKHQAAAIVKTWVDNGVLIKMTYNSPSQKLSEVNGLRVDSEKAREMRLNEEG
jgi:hypothetical protein